MARAAEVLNPRFVAIENVPGAVHDSNGVFQSAKAALEYLGFQTSFGVLNALEVGVPQSRRRLMLLGSRSGKPVESQDIRSDSKNSPRTVGWAIGDLEGLQSEKMFDAVAKSTSDTTARIKYLFSKSLFDLPDSMRPPCHRDKKHSDRSIYGRLDWDRPSQTVTSGFYSMCMGRYVHPSEPRTLTAHEAARLQFFPDFYSFEAATGRGSLARMIGNAVPVKLAYAAILGLLRDGQY